MFFADRLTLDKSRRTADGFLVTRARAARTGVYRYTGAEVDPNNDHGLRDQAVVNVLRDEETVFDKKSLHSFVGKPITNDHPHEAVTADNWRDHARGVVMGAVRDGEYVAFDLLLTDAAAIAAVEDGKRELSNGYSSELMFGDFTAPDGTKCPVRQASVRGNHCALVGQGRAGSECAIVDAASCNSLPADLFDLLTDKETYSGEKRDGKNGSLNDGDGKMPHTLIIDGLQVTEVSDQAKAAIEKLQAQFRDADARAKDAEASVATLTTDKATLEAKVATLEQQVQDAKLTPKQLHELAAAHQATVEKAKSMGVTVGDSMDGPAIMRAVVDAKLGDAAKAWNDEQIAVSFATLTKDVKVDDQQIDPVRNAMSGGLVTVGDAHGDYQKSREKYVAALRDGHRAPAAAAA